jgi:hypothetical protein
MGMTEIFNSEVIVYCLGIEISNPRALWDWQPYFNPGFTVLILKKCRVWPAGPHACYLQQWHTWLIKVKCCRITHTLTHKTLLKISSTLSM